MRTPKSPNFSASIAKWEEWIVHSHDYMKANKQTLPRSLYIYETFEAYKQDTIKKFGTNWETALKWGDDKIHIVTMEYNWKLLAYVIISDKDITRFYFKPYLPSSYWL